MVGKSVGSCPARCVFERRKEKGRKQKKEKRQDDQLRQPTRRERSKENSKQKGGKKRANPQNPWLPEPTQDEQIKSK